MHSSDNTCTEMAKQARPRQGMYVIRSAHSEGSLEFATLAQKETSCGSCFGRGSRRSPANDGRTEDGCAECPGIVFSSSVIRRPAFCSAQIRISVSGGLSGRSSGSPTQTASIISIAPPLCVWMALHKGPRMFSSSTNLGIAGLGHDGKRFDDLQEWNRLTHDETTGGM